MFLTNQLIARGNVAADPESRDDARHNAPLTVLALDRIVSLQDYEDFAGAFSGIGKALATWTWDGERRAVFVTVAGPGPAGSDLLTVSKRAPEISAELHHPPERLIGIDERRFPCG